MVRATFSLSTHPLDMRDESPNFYDVISKAIRTDQFIVLKVVFCKF